MACRSVPKCGRDQLQLLMLRLTVDCRCLQVTTGVASQWSLARLVRPLRRWPTSSGCRTLQTLSMQRWVLQPRFYNCCEHSQAPYMGCLSHPDSPLHLHMCTTSLLCARCCVRKCSNCAAAWCQGTPGKPPAYSIWQLTQEPWP